METGIHELTAGYALDALDSEERRAYEAHLAGCEHCQQELESFWETTAALAVAATGPAPSPGLRDRILADVRAEPPQNVVPFEARRRRTAPVLGAVAAVAAVVALAVGLWASSLSGDLDETRTALRQAQANAAVLADPGARTVSLQAGDGRLVVDPEGRAVLVLEDAEPVGSDRTYELWIVPGGDLSKADPAGLFPGAEGMNVVGVEGTVRPGDLVAVTIEQAGGAETPTLPPVAASNSV
jgi:anti-sigma-K factor RskA